MQHAVADYLRGLDSGEPGIGVQDDFQEVTVFLRNRLPPQGMSTDERKRLLVRSQNFCLFKETLNHKGAY